MLVIIFSPVMLLLDSVVRQRRREFAVRVGLGDQKLASLFQSRNSVGTSGPAQRRLFEARELDQRRGEPGAIAALQAAHAASCGDRLPGFLGIVIDGGLGIAR
jgi:hypothetical protein